MTEVLTQLRSICRDLKEAEEHELADQVLCAIAALADTPSPKSDLSYSYVMRKLRENSPDRVNEFQLEFKQGFENALDRDLPNPEELALMQALQKTKLQID